MTHARHAHGPLVRALREARNLTLVELGATTGLSPGYLSRVEYGQRTASWEATVRLAEALAVGDVAYLTGQLPPYRPLRRFACPDTTFTDFAVSAGLTGDELDDIERGAVTPAPDVVVRIAQRLGIPVDVLTRENPVDQDVT